MVPKTLKKPELVSASLKANKSLSNIIFVENLLEDEVYPSKILQKFFHERVGMKERMKEECTHRR